MRKIIFLTGRYLPKPEATGLCIHKIASCLADEGFCVETICMGDKEERFLLDGVNVKKIKAPFFMRESEISSFCVFVSRLHKLFHLFNYPLRSNTLRKRFVKAALKDIDYDDEVNVVASFSPFEAVSSLKAIRKKAKCKSINLFYYCADTLSNEQGKSAILSAGLREKIGRQREINIFSFCKTIFVMDCHTKHYMSDNYIEFKDKMAVVDFPLLDKTFYSAISDNPNKMIQIVYTGTLYKTLRNPSFACDAFLKFVDLDFKLTFVGGGDCQDILEKKATKSNGKIEYLGKQSYEEAKHLIKQADILLSLGNLESPMMPSKIFEYISTGKPIIHFSSWEGDPCIPILSKYGNSLIISSDKDVFLIPQFLKKHNVVSWQEIETLFYKSLPSFTAGYLR